MSYVWTGADDVPQSMKSMRQRLLTSPQTTEYAPIGRVYGSGSNLQFIDERTIGANTDNGAGEGVIALINGLRDPRQARWASHQRQP